MKKRLLSLLCIIIVTVTMFSTLSIGVNAVYTGRPDEAPTLRITDVGYTSVKLEWSDYNDYSSQYLIYRSPTGKKGTWTKIATTKAEVSSYTDKTVVPNKVYYYTVKSYIHYPDSKIKFVSQMSTVWRVSTQIARPIFTLVGNGGKGVVLKWDIDKEMNGVAIYKSTTGKAGSWTKIKVIGNNKTKTYTDSKVEIGKTYYYCYKVYKTVNGKNYYSQSSKAYKSTILDVSVPQNLKAVALDEGIKITYSKSLGTIGYMIYRSETGKKGSWKKLETTKSNNTLEYLDKTAVPGKTYYYTVKSYKTVNGETHYSDSAKAIKVLNTAAPPELSFVTGDSITFSNYYEEIPVKLSFKNLNDEQALRIYIDEFEVSDIDDFTVSELDKFMNNCKFLFEIDEDKSTDTELYMLVYRVAPGTGTLKFEYNGAVAELTVNCGEFEYDKDAAQIAEDYAKAISDAYDAAVILEDALNSDKYAVIVEKGVAAREILSKAVPNLEDAKSILEAHRGEFTGYNRFHAEINEIDEALRLVSYACSSLEDIENAPEPLLLCEKSIKYLIEYFESIS